MVETKKNAMPSVSLVMGILGLLFFCCCYGGFIFGSLAIIFALLSRTGEPMAGQAKAGLILGIIAIILTILLWGGIIIFAILDGSAVTPDFLMIRSLPGTGGRWL